MRVYIAQMLRLATARTALTRIALGAALLLPAIFRDGPPVAARPRTCARRADVAACPATSNELRAVAFQVREGQALHGSPFRQRRTGGASSPGATVPGLTELTILPVLVHEPGVTPRLPEFLPAYRQTTLVPRPPPSA
jgi:hypothetical protein